MTMMIDQIGDAELISLSIIGTIMPAEAQSSWKSIARTVSMMYIVKIVKYKSNNLHQNRMCGKKESG